MVGDALGSSWVELRTATSKAQTFKARLVVAMDF